MPYSKLSDLPKEQVDQYSHHQKEAFLAAFNSALVGFLTRHAPR